MRQSMYDYFYRVEDEHWWFKARRNVILALIDKYCHVSGAKVLDIGCGTGIMLNHLSKYGEVWGLDKSPDAVRYSQIKSPASKVILSSFPEEPPEEKFNMITLFDVIEHIDDDQKSLAVAADMLEQNGSIIITVPAYRFLWSDHDAVNHHKRRYTIRELEEKIIRAGLRIEKISYYNSILFLPAVIAKFIGRFLKRKDQVVSFGVAFPPKIFNYLLETIFSFEKKLLPNFNFPFGVSIIAIASKHGKI